MPTLLSERLNELKMSRNLMQKAIADGIHIKDMNTGSANPMRQRCSPWPTISMSPSTTSSAALTTPRSTDNPS